MPPQLHELLAAENDVRGQWKQISEETLHVFAKPQMFQGKVTKLTMTKPGLDDQTKRATEESGSAVETMGTTVGARLQYTGPFFMRLVDHRLEKDLTNQKAKADIIVDNQVIASGIPATCLLDLEDRLTSYRAIYMAIPTLDVKKEWEGAENLGSGIWKTKNPEVRSKTEKDFHSRILVAPTDKHPAQIEKWNVDVVVGKTEVTEHSGMLTSARKAEILSRCDKLIVAVKEARARANQTPIERTDGSLGAKLLNFMEASEVKA
jgi:hypothetical protein